MRDTAYLLVYKENLILMTLRRLDGQQSDDDQIDIRF